MTTRKLTLLFFSLCGLIGCGATDERSAKVADSEQSVAYLSNADGNLDIYIKNIKSQEVNQVTNNEPELGIRGWTFCAFHNLYNFSPQKSSF